MSTIPTFQEMLTKYLFDDEAHTGDALLDESLIRKNGLKSGVDDNGKIYYFETTEPSTDDIEITASDFMTEGVGRFVNGANSSVVKNFMTINT